MVAVATAVVCTMTFSATVKSLKYPTRWPTLNNPKPDTAPHELPLLDEVSMVGSGIPGMNDMAHQTVDRLKEQMPT